MKILYIEWIDAVAGSGWCKPTEVEVVHICRTIGFLIKEDSDCMVIASTISQDESNARIAIPKKWIKRKRVVKP